MTSQKTRRSPAAGAMAAALILASGGAAFAQEADEEIVVTAQKREQSLQDVPIAVTAIGVTELARTGVADLRDLQMMTPSLNVTSNTSDATTTAIRIRGVGTTGNNVGLEGAVGAFVDGVYRSRSGVALTELYDVKRVEVLRGPQGTLFGKNTSAGAISVITNEPEFAFHGGLSLDGSNYDAFKTTAFVTGPLAGDKLAGRFSGFFSRRDGTQTNVLNGQDFNDRNRFGGRGQLLFKPTDDVSFRLIADYYQANETGAAAPYIVNPPEPFFSALQTLGAHIFVPAQPFEQDVAVNRPLKQNTRDWGVSGELNWKLGFGTLTNIAGYRQFFNLTDFDQDFNAADIIGIRDDHFNIHQITEEMRLSGRVTDLGFGHALDWLVGGYYAKESIDESMSIAYGSQFGNYMSLLAASAGVALSPAFFPAGDGGQRFNFSQDGETWALFTHNTWEITEKLKVTAGIRYNNESKTGIGDLDFHNNPAACTTFVPFYGPLAAAATLLCPRYSYVGKTDKSAITGTASIGYDFTSKIKSYISYSRGYKSGGVNLDWFAGGGVINYGTDSPPSTLPLGAAEAPKDPTFKPEYADSYELGLKTQFSRTTLNVALFYTKFYNFQLNTFTGTNFIITNVAGVTSKGVEVEVLTAPFDWLTLTGSGSYALATYSGDLAKDPNPVVSSLASRIITNAPRLTLNGSATVSQPVPGTELGSYLRLDASYRSTVNTGSDLAAAKAQDPVFLLNGRLGVTMKDSQYELALWARNMLDRSYKTLAIDTPLEAVPGQPGGYSSYLGEPRTYGISAKMNF